MCVAGLVAPLLDYSLTKQLVVEAVSPAPLPSRTTAPAPAARPARPAGPASDV
jgi:hypothetical protein